MDNSQLKEPENGEILEPPAEFPFPFKPYAIQHDFMKALYSALENGKLGIFESPTGTGKSMSMICGALTWLEDNEKRVRQLLERGISMPVTIENEDSDDWITLETHRIQQKQKCAEKKHHLQWIEAKEQEMEKIRRRVKDRHKTINKCEKSNKVFSAKSVVNKDEDINMNDEEDDDLLEDCIPSVEGETLENENEEEKYKIKKVFFCSRTHSQLSQLASELRRSIHSNKRVVCLASRQSYCVNPSVQALRNLTLINDRCLDLQRSGSSKVTAKDKDGCTTKRARSCGGCPQKISQRVEELKEEILTDVHDVEDLVKKGTEIKACPYYAARAAVKDAQVVLLPYNTLLHSSTREAVGIDLQGNIIIIDEAHNLLDTIAHMYSAEVTGQQLSDAIAQLKAYRNRYEKKFSAFNLLRLDQMIFYISRLLRHLEGKQFQNDTHHTSSGKVYQLVDFFAAAGVENMNPFMLLEFSKKSKLPHKLRGFAAKGLGGVEIQERKSTSGLREFLLGIKEANAKLSKVITVERENPPDHGCETSKNPILPILSFLECLTNSVGDGRIVCFRQSTVGASRMKFLLLNPAEYFKAVVKEARAVVVAGGTMQPLTEFRDQLFLAAGGTIDRIQQFSCDHIVPQENILPLVLTKGPTGRVLNFNYESRNSREMILEVERILSNVCNLVPGGIVCFFPSYDYEQQVYSYLQKSGALEKLQMKKKVFREPKKASETDQILRDYASAIKKSMATNVKKGALMLSVVGGKLSEGLNFSDDLGRLVIVVGMPYPNKNSPDLQEKMNYLNAQLGAGAGQRHYEALCMKAVNQSIGRAIRHRADYAAVILADHRYNRPNIQSSLPGWIQRSLQTCDKFGLAVGQMRQFFASKSSLK